MFESKLSNSVSKVNVRGISLFLLKKSEYLSMFSW
ncbi:Uncharacterised protein, partial [Mesomycoplasma hyorhinis]